MERRDATRLQDLYAFEILDSPREQQYDDIVALARLISKTPGAFISFVDAERLWFKSIEGLPQRDLPREQSFCQFVVDSGKSLLVEDVLKDQRFIVCRDKTLMRRPANASQLPPDGHHPEALDIRFYFGVPLKSNSGSVLGTLCVVDYQPRRLDPEVINGLERLAGQVITLLELRRTNATVEAERETFTTLFEVAPVPLVLARDGVIHRSNHSFAALVTDSDTGSLQGKPVGTYLPELDLEGDPDVGVSAELKNEVGQSTAVQVHHTRIRVSREAYHLLALHDLTDRLEKEQVLQDQRTQAENANRIKDTFLSLVSHDLKSPLAGIFTMLDLLATSGSSFSDQARDEAIRDLRSAAAVLVEMINQLLNIHRLESGQLQVETAPVQIYPLVQDIVLTLRRQIREKELTIDVALDPMFSLTVDEGLFREALFNLVSNAVKFSPMGGTVRVEGDGDEVRVLDHGAGVAPGDLPLLFRQEVKTSRLGTAGEAGTGLGLPLTKDIMRAHHGDVLVRTTGPQGSCFVLTLDGGTPAL